MKKKIFIFLFLLSFSNAFPIEVHEYPAQPPSSWKKAANFLGFGLSTEFQLPSANKEKVAYGCLSIGLGLSEIFASEQIMNSRIPAPTMFAHALNHHAISNIISGVSILGNLIWDTAASYIGVPLEQSNTIKNAAYNKMNGGVQILAGLSCMGGQNSLFLVPGLACACRGVYNLLRTDIAGNTNTKPWDRICNGGTRLLASVILMDFYLSDLRPSFFLPKQEITTMTDTGVIIHDPYNPSYIYFYDNSAKIIRKHIANPTPRLVSWCPGEEIIGIFFKSLELNPQNYSKTILRNVCSPDRMDGFTVDEIMATSGISEFVGGVKDTFFIFQMMVLASFKTVEADDKEWQIKRLYKLRGQASSQHNSRQPPYENSKKPQYSAHQPPKAPTENIGGGPENDSDSLFINTRRPKATITEKKEKIKTRGEPFQKNKSVEKKGFPGEQSVPSKEKPTGNLKENQEELPLSLPPDFPEKPKSLNWRQARTTLRHYGINIDDSVEGSRIKLTFGNTTRILHIHKKAGSKIKGGRMQDILYMLWVASQAQLETGRDLP